MKNIFFIIIDALRMDSLNDDMSEKIAPNLKKMCGKGLVEKIITNGQVTKFVVPSIFTQTFPLDYGGYNYGIKNRPKSFVELLNKNKILCRMFEGHDIDGPYGRCERGFSQKKFYYDKRLLLEGFLKKKILYDIGRWRSSEIDKDEIIKIIQTELLEILKYMIKQERIDFGFLKKRLGTFSLNEKNNIESEIYLLTENPELVLKKIININPYFYYDYLGKSPSKKLFLNFKIRNKFFSYKKKVQALFNNFFSTEINFIPSRPKITSSCKKMFSDSLDGFDKIDSKVFTYIHFMDLHDHNIFTSFADFWSKIKFLPRVVSARLNSKNEYFKKLTYDLTLCEVDNQLSVFLKKLKKIKKLNDSIFFVIGDHGDGWDDMRSKELRKDFGYRTYYEHINIPFIISPFKHKKLKKPFLYDSMSISASILKILKIKPDNSFKGRSIFSKGSQIIITENCGRGNADIIKKDIFFTLTSLHHKLFCKIEGKKLTLNRLYEIDKDPRELNNIINDISLEIPNKFLSYLYKKRKEILNIRGFKKSPKLGHPNVHILSDHAKN